METVTHRGKNGHVKRLATLKIQYSSPYYSMGLPRKFEFMAPKLNHFTGEKKSIMELAAICGLPYKDGKVG
jgi:hypothetical protein